MSNVSVAFKLLKPEETPEDHYEFFGFHMVYEIKMDFTRKARLVVEGRRTPDSMLSMYAGFASRESVQIVFTHAVLNDLEIFAANISSAYLQASCSSNYWTKFSSDFGEYQGQTALVVRAAYGLKEAGADSRNHRRYCMFHLGYKSSNGDNDVWMKPARNCRGEQ